MKFSDYERALLKKFFQEVYGRVWKAFQRHYSGAYIEIRMINQEGHITREFFPVHQLGFEKALEEAISYVEKWNGEENKYNAFWGIALRKEKKGSKEATIPYIAFVPFDLDILKDHLHLTGELPNIEEAEAREKVISYYQETIRPRLKKFDLIPTWVYYTGHGVQGIWALVGFITERELLEVKNFLVEGMESDPKIYELARILRVPFSINWKIPEHPKRGELIEKNEVYYDFQDFLEKVKAYYKEYGSKTSTPETGEVSPELRRKFSQSKRPPCVEKALNGVKEGMRNSTAYFLASYFAQVGWKLDEIKEFLKNEWDPRNDPPIASNDGLRSLEATIESAYNNVVGGKSEGPTAQKMAGCSWARSNGLCLFKNITECPIGKRALANKLKQVAKEMEVRPYTLEEFEGLVRTWKGAPKWINEILGILKAEGLSQVTPLDLQKIVEKLSPPKKKIDKSPREVKDKEAPAKEVKSLDDFTEEEMSLIIRHYVMEAIKLDTTRTTLMKIKPPFLFLKEEKKGKKTIYKLNKRLLKSFAKKLGLPMDELVSGWDLVAKIQEAFGVSDDELRALIVEAIKDMLGTYMRIPPCIEALVDKLAEGETLDLQELDLIVSWIKYRAQGKEKARAKRGYDKRIGLWEFMVEMLPGFEANIGYWRLEFLKRYENAKPFKCPKELLSGYCNPDKCPFQNPRDMVESILTEIEAVYLYGSEKLGLVIGEKEHSITYEPLSGLTPSTLRKLHKALEKAWGGPLVLKKDELIEIFKDITIRGLWKPILEPEEIVEDTLISYFLQELESGVTKYPLMVNGYLTYDPKAKVIYAGDKGQLIGVINRAFERYNLRGVRDPRELTPLLNKLEIFLGSTKKRFPILDSQKKVVSTTTPWIFSLPYIERKIGRKVNVKYLKPEDIFFEADELTFSMDIGEETKIEEIQGEILEILKKEPKTDEEVIEELKQRYPREMVRKALEELFFQGSVEYDPKNDKIVVREGEL